MVQLDSVSKFYGGLVAVDDCSLTIPVNRITGLIGPNGAGKTTAFNLIAGLDRPSRGKILLDNEDITALPAYRRQAKGIARTFQLAREFSRMSVLENLMVAADNAAGESVFNAIFRPSRYRQPEATARQRALQTLEFLELQDYAKQLAGQLSGGQKKLLELGRALMQQPKVLLLDEIGAGVNRSLLAKIVDKIRLLNTEHGYTVCLIEHDLDAVGRICDSVIVMVQGRVLANGSVAEIRTDPRVIDAYFGGGRRTNDQNDNNNNGNARFR